MNTQVKQLNSEHPLLVDDGRKLSARVRQFLDRERPRLSRLWAYYRNAAREDIGLTTNTVIKSQRPYRQAQEWGLPARITGRYAGRDVFDATPAGGIERKEVVIENDIGWRIDTMVDFLFGRAIVINSTASDPDRRATIEALLREIFAVNGGLVFLQELALLGAVYGHVDVLVKLVPPNEMTPAAAACGKQLLGEAPMRTGLRKFVTRPSKERTSPKETKVVEKNEVNDYPTDLNKTTSTTESTFTTETNRTNDRSGTARAEPVPGEQPLAVENPSPLNDRTPDPGASHPSPSDFGRHARSIRFEIVEPARALPLLDPRNCSCVDAFATVYQIDRPDPPEVRRSNWPLHWLAKKSADAEPGSVGRSTVVELLTRSRWQKYEDNKLVAEGANALGRLPLVHVQNVPDPLSFSALGEVEQLIPLQDELNTRLSDRANRIAMTSFRMYLGKGIDGFTDLPIAPGQMWATDNADADVLEFGGDGGCPSEESHIAEVREALDKISGVSPVAAGAVRGKIGNLTSAAALRVTMMSLVSRTERKRSTYGMAVAQLSELALAWLHEAGLFSTTPEERGVAIHWPNPLPSNESETLEQARTKLSLGVPQEVLLRELGYLD